MSVSFDKQLQCAPLEAQPEKEIRSLLVCFIPSFKVVRSSVSRGRGLCETAVRAMIVVAQQYIYQQASSARLDLSRSLLEVPRARTISSAHLNVQTPQLLRDRRVHRRELNGLGSSVSFEPSCLRIPVHIGKVAFHHSLAYVSFDVIPLKTLCCQSLAEDTPAQWPIVSPQWAISIGNLEKGHAMWILEIKRRHNVSTQQLVGPPGDIWSCLPSEKGSTGQSVGGIQPSQGSQLLRVAMDGKLHGDESWAMYSRHTVAHPYEAPTAMEVNSESCLPGHNKGYDYSHRTSVQGHIIYSVAWHGLRNVAYVHKYLLLFRQGLTIVLLATCLKTFEIDKFRPTQLYPSWSSPFTRALFLSSSLPVIKA